MATGAKAILKQYVLTRVDSNTVILIPHFGTRDQDTVAVVDIKSVCVMTKRVAIGTELIARSVVDNNVFDQQIVDVVDAKRIDGCIQNSNGIENRVVQVVGFEELRLGGTATIALAIPPEGTLPIKNGAGGTFDGDVVSTDGKQRTRPLSEVPSCTTFEDDLLAKILAPRSGALQKPAPSHLDRGLGVIPLCRH